MKKQNNQKGFTLVELVIVIAVIAILAGVLIPTFSGIVEKANKSAALQEATNTYKELLIEEEFNGNLNDLNTTANEVDLYILIDGKYWFKVIDGELESCDAPDTVATNNGIISITNYSLVSELKTEKNWKIEGTYSNVYVYNKTN